jgi:DNA-directed RNA polymerase specialized sigma24 family protein
VTADRAREICLKGALSVASTIDDAEDAATEAFLRVWPVIETVNPRAQVSYLFIAGRNIIGDMRRKDRRLIPSCEKLLGYRPDTRWQEGFAEVEAALIIEGIQGKETRSILILEALQFTAEEGAAAMGVSTPSYKSRLYRARARFKGAA